MDIALIKRPNYVKKFSGLDAHRTGFFDLGLGIAADRDV
jgi:hypothetical protein